MDEAWMPESDEQAAWDEQAKTMGEAQQWHRVAIALGSNLGESRQILEGALKALSANPAISLDTYSSFYRTAAVGPPQPDYLNACALLSTTLPPTALLDAMLQIEAQFGRERYERWGPRLLDLDLLLYADQVVKLPHLQVPHPRMRERAFVLVPLAEIAASWRDPITGEAIATLLSRVDPIGVQCLPESECPNVSDRI